MSSPFYKFFSNLNWEDGKYWYLEKSYKSVILDINQTFDELATHFSDLY